MTVAHSHELIHRSNSLLDRIRDGFPNYWQDFREDPRWIFMFLLARILPIRNLLWPSSPRSAVPPVGGSLFDVDVEAACADLRLSGLHEGLCLPSELVEEIRRFADATPCFGNHDRSADDLPSAHMQRSSAERPITSGHYFERINLCPAIGAVQRDPKLAQIATAYLGPSAQIISTRLWWSFPLPPRAPGALAAPPERDMLHFDLDDWRMIKFFFYLTAVDSSTGPHLYITGSHRQRALKHQFSITVGRPLEEVLRAYGGDRLVEIFGPVGSGFVEDPFGFHAGALASRAPRLMLEVAFGVSAPNRRRYFGERSPGGRRPPQPGAAPQEAAETPLAVEV